MPEKPCIVMGVSGGIAVYKAADLVRKIMDLDTDVHCVMTENATRFVTPLTFQTLSRNPVLLDSFSAVTSWDAEHVSLADRASLIVVCPATANLLGKVAHGIADDLLSTLIMAAATRTRILFCPAMNAHMWENPIVQENVKKLQDLGYLFVAPEQGRLASGAVGLGRLAGLDVILERIRSLLREGA